MRLPVSCLGPQLAGRAAVDICRDAHTQTPLIWSRSLPLAGLCIPLTAIMHASIGLEQQTGSHDLKVLQVWKTCMVPLAT